MEDIKKSHFDREIINKWAIAENNQLIDSISEKFDLKQYNSNGFIGYIYIDHMVGISLQIHSLCRIEPSEKPLIVANMQDIGHILILRYGMFDDVSLLSQEEVDDFSLPAEPDWLVHYEPFKYSDIRERVDLDQFRAPGFFDDVSVILISKNNEYTPEVVWVRLDEMMKGGMVFQGQLLNEPNADFGVHIGEIIPVFYVENQDERYLISGNGTTDLNQKN